jgi:hypothetical protein
MKYRKLRIAWSAGCGILSVLLIVLWVRSFSICDAGTWGISGGPGYMFGSINGELSAVRVRSSQGKVTPGWGAWRYPAGKGLFWSTSDLQNLTAVRYESFATGVTILAIPYWFPVTLVAALTALPWIRQLKWRFSLRTLLIAATVVAVGLGLLDLSPGMEPVSKLGLVLPSDQPCSFAEA